MKCMNPKCDSEEFNMVYTYSLTDTEEEECFWVVCDECEMKGPACDTAEEARSYFENQPAEYAPKLNSNCECIEKSRSLTLMFREGEKLENFRQRVMDRIAQSVSIPTEVLNMEFGSGYSACKEAFGMLKENEDQMVKGAVVGTSFYEAFVESTKRNDDLQFKDGEIRKPLTPGPTQIADSPVPQIADRPTPAINFESFSDKCNCGASARRTATTIKCTNPECYHYEE